ncbi:MAG TPA: aminoacetone oxidase family FAD-binding enzyme [Gemmatimonadales bacterium]
MTITTASVPPRELPVVVAGAGAAGLLAALFAARGGAPVVLVEGTRDGGRKILISGGGRCNILPSRVSPERFVTGSSPHSLRNILRSWPLEAQRAFLEHELGMGLVLEEDTRKLFPATHRARDVRDRLVARVRDAGVTLRFGTRVTGLIPPADPAGPWRVLLTDEGSLDAAAVVLATGGLSVPATGSDGAGLAMARALGHTVHEPYPALTPLLADPPIHADLAGVSLDVTLRVPGARPRFETSGGLLFTHRGYSGPAVLDASHLAVRSPGGATRQPLTVQWTPLDAPAWDAALRTGRGNVGTVLARTMPSRLAERLLGEAGAAAGQAVAHLDRDTRLRLITLLTAYPLPWTGHAGFHKAEVTGGGVALAEVDPRTMESRRRPRLFLCGEMLDAFGPIGGHNFVWAWVTGRAAGIGAGQVAQPR